MQLGVEEMLGRLGRHREPRVDGAESPPMQDKSCRLKLKAKLRLFLSCTEAVQRPRWRQPQVR
jgi:hypothetical protein